MRFIILAAFSALLATGANAQAPQEATAPAVSATPLQAAAIKRRTVLWDKNGVRIGTVLDVIPTAAGGVDTVAVLSGENSYRVAGDTLTLSDSKLVTSLTRREATAR